MSDKLRQQIENEESQIGMPTEELRVIVEHSNDFGSHYVCKRDIARLAEEIKRLRDALESSIEAMEMYLDCPTIKLGPCMSWSRSAVDRAKQALNPTSEATNNEGGTDGIE